MRNSIAKKGKEAARVFNKCESSNNVINTDKTGQTLLTTLFVYTFTDAWEALPPSQRLKGSDLYGPDGLLQRVEELEAETVLLRGSLNELAGIKQHCSHPLAILVGFIDE